MNLKDKAEKDCPLSTRCDYIELANIMKVMLEKYDHECGSYSEIVRLGITILSEKFRVQFPESTFVSTEKAIKYLETFGIKSQKRSKTKMEKILRKIREEKDEVYGLLETEEQRLEFEKNMEMLRNFKPK